MIDLQILEKEISYEMNALHLLSSLPASYQMLSHILLHCDRNIITYNEVVSALLTYDLQQKMMLSSDSSSFSKTLNVIRGRSHSKNDKNEKHVGSKVISKSRGKIPLEEDSSLLAICQEWPHQKELRGE